jgi:hypothetical protein
MTDISGDIYTQKWVKIPSLQGDIFVNCWSCVYCYIGWGQEPCNGCLRKRVENQKKGLCGCAPPGILSARLELAHYYPMHHPIPEQLKWPKALH